MRKRLGSEDRAFLARMQSRAMPFGMSRAAIEGVEGWGSSGELIAVGSWLELAQVEPGKRKEGGGSGTRGKKRKKKKKKGKRKEMREKNIQVCSGFSISNFFSFLYKLIRDFEFLITTII